MTLVLCVCGLMLAFAVYAQSQAWQALYKVKKKDTIYGIAKRYNLTVDELMDANPEMRAPGYRLCKGDQIAIPYPSTPSAPKAATPSKQATPASRMVPGTVRVGVMLPLHNVDGDGQRMLEYYRGVLMACDDIRTGGANVRVHAWNVDIDANVQAVLNDDNARDCDIIFGPLYTKQVRAMSDFCKANGIRLVIPFSVSGDPVATDAGIFQIYQSPELQNNAAVDAFVERFKNAHPVFVDCNDSTSRKGTFTSALRKRLESEGIAYNITNVKSAEAMFAKAFDPAKRNVVVLNTGRSPELNVVFSKLDGLRVSNPDLQIAMYGYTEWLMYTNAYLEYFHKYEAYIPSYFFYNPLDPKTAAVEKSYRTWFKSEMRRSLPRFALTGYDHAQFFINGLYRQGDKFTGEQQNGYTPLQTPFKFKRVSGGGMQNRTFMLIHYKPDHKVESISY